jgi:hypothetical protein
VTVFKAGRMASVRKIGNVFEGELVVSENNRKNFLILKGNNQFLGCGFKNTGVFIFDYLLKQTSC